MAVWASTDAGFGDKVARFPEERLRMVTALVATVARDPPICMSTRRWSEGVTTHRSGRSVWRCYYLATSNRCPCRSFRAGLVRGPAAVAGELPGRVWGAPGGRDLFVSVYNDQQRFTCRNRNGNLRDCWYDRALGWKGV